MRAREMNLQYLEKRNGIIRYRRAVPEALRKHVKKTAWVHTYPAGTPVARAVAHAERLAAKHGALIAAARHGGPLPDDSTVADAEASYSKFSEAERLDIQAFFATAGVEDAPESPFVNVLRNKGQYIPDKITLQTAYANDKKTYGGKRDEGAIELTVQAFAPFVTGKDIRHISRADAQAFVASMRKARLSEGTVRRRVGPIRALLNRAYLDNEIERTNPFSRLGVKGTGSAKDRLPFHTSHLAKIDSYLSSAMVQPKTRNIVRMLKLTGCSLGEVAGLMLADLSLESAVPFVVIRENAQRGIKTEVRERRVPLIGEALEAARDAYQRARVAAKGKSVDKVALFAGFSSKHGANGMSATLNAALRRAGVPKSPRLSLHSFRHTMKEALRAAGVADHIQRRVQGHSGHGVADKYGSPALRLEEARDALLTAVPHLGNVDESIYTAAELV